MNQLYYKNLLSLRLSLENKSSISPPFCPWLNPQDPVRSRDMVTARLTRHVQRAKEPLHGAHLPLWDIPTLLREALEALKALQRKECRHSLCACLSLRLFDKHFSLRYNNPEKLVSLVPFCR